MFPWLYSPSSDSSLCSCSYSKVELGTEIINVSKNMPCNPTGTHDPGKFWKQVTENDYCFWRKNPKPQTNKNKTPRLPPKQQQPPKQKQKHHPSHTHTQKSLEPNCQWNVSWIREGHKDTDKKVELDGRWRHLELSGWNMAPAGREGPLLTPTQILYLGILLLDWKHYQRSSPTNFSHKDKPIQLWVFLHLGWCLISHCSC